MVLSQSTQTQNTQRPKTFDQNSVKRQVLKFGPTRTANYEN